MKSSLPEGHGLAAAVLQNSLLLPRVHDEPSITDAQYDALAAGVARGESVLVSAPTSTGKTLVGWWSVSAALAGTGRIVYLVSYRALAHQKFDECQRLFLENPLGGDRSSIVCATGDSVEDASRRKTSAPLSSRILVATYEKFLGCLSTGGPPRDLSDVTFVCDEIQLIGDKTRGRNVELLLTLLKRAGWRQFIGLSAVLSDRDARAVADWLSLTLVRNPNREKKLTIECRSPQKRLVLTSAPGREPSWSEERSAQGYSPSPLAVVKEMSERLTHRPVIAFCMKVDDTFELASQAASSRGATREVSVPQGLDIGGPLLGVLKKGVAFHNAELSEEERIFVEDRLANGQVDIVFATSTLAAGVNFPLGSAVFVAWKRWNFERSRHEPISRAEFQNMSGRVGRMGQVADYGRVILNASGGADLQLASNLMNMVDHEDLESSIEPSDFGPLVLQILAGRLCRSRDQAFDLLASTLSASRERAKNVAGVSHWRGSLETQIDRLIGLGCIIETGQALAVTALGEAIARTGLKPETGIFFIEGLSKFADNLIALLPTDAVGGSEDDLAFILAHAALASPEFNYEGGRPTRQINWRVSEPRLVENPSARRLAPLLLQQPWTSDVGAANGALLLAAWVTAQPRDKIETTVGRVRLGTVQGLARDVAWILTGISEIVGAVTAPTLALESKPEAVRQPDVGLAVRRLVRAIRRQASRIGAGLPSDVLWMTSLDLQEPPVRLSRPQIIALRNARLVRPIDLMNGAQSADAARRKALGAEANPRLANLVREASRRWKLDDREYCKKLHLRRAEVLGGSGIVDSLYGARGSEFEVAFEAALNFVAVPYSKLDRKGNIGRPDYLISIEDYPGIVVELKTKVSDSDFVSLTAATEILSASEMSGYKDHFCLSVCSPGVEPSVPGFIEACGRLCVVEVCDLVEALLRLREGTLSRIDFYNWITTPGIALREDLTHSR